MRPYLHGCMHVCMYGRMHACMDAWTNASVLVSMSDSVSLWVGLRSTRASAGVGPAMSAGCSHGRLNIAIRAAAALAAGPGRAVYGLTARLADSPPAGGGGLPEPCARRAAETSRSTPDPRAARPPSSTSSHVVSATRVRITLIITSVSTESTALTFDCMLCMTTTYCSNLCHVMSCHILS